MKKIKSDIVEVDKDTKLKHFMNQINSIHKDKESREKRLIKALSNCDCKISDLLHYIENTKFKCTDSYKILKAIKEVCLHRRAIKVLMLFSQKYEHLFEEVSNYSEVLASKYVNNTNIIDTLNL